MKGKYSEKSFDLEGSLMRSSKRRKASNFSQCIYTAETKLEKTGEILRKSEVQIPREIKIEKLKSKVEKQIED